MKRLLFSLVLPGIALLAQDAFRLRPAAGPSARGSGGPAAEALLDGPSAMAADAEGNVYIAESNAGLIHRVRAADGAIERVAGTGILADGPEGRNALRTDLISPSALAVAPDGTLVFADGMACRLRRILSDGRILNVGGTGRCAGSGAGGFGGFRDRIALDTDLGKVSGITFDPSGRMVFTEEDTHQVRRVDTDGYIRTLSGSGVAGFAGDGSDAVYGVLNSPGGVAYDTAGNLYIADGRNCRVRRIGSDNIITTAAGTPTCVSRSGNFTGGTPSRTAIGRLAGIAYDAATNVFYVAAPGQARLLKLDPNTSRISSVIGNGTLGMPDFSKSPNAIIANEPWGVAVTPSGKVLTAASTSFQVYQLLEGDVSLFAGKWPGVDAPMRPAGTCTASDGALIIVDAGTERILRQDPATGEMTLVAGSQYPTGFTDGDGGPATQAKIANPRRVFCAPSGEIFLAHGAQIRAIDAAGKIRTVRASVGDPAGLLLDGQGRLLFSESTTHRVLRYDFSDKTTTVLAGNGRPEFTGDGGAATEAQLDTPGDLAFDSAGNLLIADRGNRRVRKVSLSTGVITTVIGSSREYSYSDISGERADDIGLGLVTGLAADASGNIFVTDGTRLLLIPQAAGARVTIMAGYAGEDDAGTPNYRVGPVNGIDGLSLGAAGGLYASVRAEGLVLLVDRN